MRICGISFISKYLYSFELHQIHSVSNGFLSCTFILKLSPYKPHSKTRCVKWDQITLEILINHKSIEEWLTGDHETIINKSSLKFGNGKSLTNKHTSSLQIKIRFGKGHQLPHIKWTVNWTSKQNSKNFTF